jgi:hypothetical protein
MWWRLLHSDTQRRRIRYIGKVNNRVCKESFGCRAAGLCRQNPARSIHWLRVMEPLQSASMGGGRPWVVFWVSAAGPAALQRSA